VRISTQAFNRIDGDRKVLECVGPDGIARPVEVEIDLTECGVCGVLVAPTAAAGVAHARWHQETDQQSRRAD
jgi:hypothetical protein